MAAALPSGTITLLFSDIEGSTETLKRLGDSYGTLLADHHRLLLEAIESNGGRLIDTQGDATFSVFPSAPQAVAAAAQAQAALAVHPWPSGEKVKVRMGLHTGAPVAIEDRYVGIDLHRSARIMSAAHGRQVVASSVTRELAPEADWVDLGPHRLKDIERPEHLYQLVVPGLPRGFPPLRAVRLVSGLPVVPTPFVGRSDDLHRLAELVEAPHERLVTLTGPGGIGKTRLAIQVGEGWAQRHPGMASFVPLANISTVTMVVPAIGDALGAAEADSVERVVAALPDADYLLILDNLEHLQGVATAVGALLAAAPRLIVLATSRAALGLYGERVYPIAPVQVPALTRVEQAAGSDAVALFLDRAQRGEPGFRLTEANVAAVVEICRRLDGIPLAIELAAARVGFLSPAEIVARLHLDALGPAPSDAPPRQRTLRETIAWSYRLLDDEEQRLFRNLAVFPGGFSLGAAEDVFPWVDVVGGVGSLVRQSLLWREEGADGTSRFRMLETVRTFALEELDGHGERDEVERRQAARLLSFLREANEGLEGPEAERSLQAIDAELGNIRSALHWSLEAPGGDLDLGLQLVGQLGWYWYTHGDSSEAIHWLQLARQGGADADPSVLVRVVYYLAATLERLDRLEEAVARFEEALSIFRQLGDDVRIGRTLNSLSALWLDLGDEERAAALATEAQVLLREADDSYGRGVGLINLGDATLTKGELDQAEAHISEGTRLFEELGNAWGVAAGQRHLAKVAYARRDLQGARHLLLQALQVAHRLGDRHATVQCLERLAGVQVQLGAPRDGVRLAAASEAMRRWLAPRRSGERRATFADTWKAARDALGDPDFERHWAEGAEMTPDQAVEYATQVAVS